MSAGDLQVVPITASATIGLGGGMGTLNIDDTELGKFADGFSSITIGNTAAGSGTVDINTATFKDPVTIAGGDINDAAAGTDINNGTRQVAFQGNVKPGQSIGALNITGNFTVGDGRHRDDGGRLRSAQPGRDP